MNSYSVKQIAKMLSTSEETVRRWIRSGKLVATCTSKKCGNIISASALNSFIKKTPKYAKPTTSDLVSTFVLSAVFSGLISGLVDFLSGRTKKTISASDVEAHIEEKIASFEKSLKAKEAELARLQNEIQADRQNLKDYRSALERLDLQQLADEVNNKLGGKDSE